MPPPNWMGSVNRRADGFDRLGIGRAAIEGAVQIDAMQPFETLIRKFARLRSGIGIEHRRLIHQPALEPHALAVFQIDGRKQDHGDHFRKLASRARPTA